jgi:hypothetical protein
MRTIGLLAGLLLIGGCGDDGGGDGNPNNIDGAPGSGDANPNAADASPNAPDARVGPDAMPNTAMSFFVTSTGNGDNGGNLGGLTGADAKCQELAINAGAGSRTWHAYLSTDSPLVNARDRIGSGPWANHAGVEVASNIANLHNNGVAGPLILTELGAVVPGEPSLDHDILTGSTPDGNVQAGKTCANWTDGSDASGAQVGHADVAADDLGVPPNEESWNSQHDPQCDVASLAATAGTGRIYCFAIN